MQKRKRKVRCPFCSFHDVRDKMVTHIEKVHADMIPEGYTAARVLFNYLNHKDHGVCVVCKRPTEWDENTNKYKRLCGRPACKNALREMYKKNMIRVKGTYNILNDPEQQKKMLANRRISGQYQFTDGTIREYTGSYEKKLLEFLDKVMGFNGDDVITPGPTFEYEFEGTKHLYITDVLIVPYNLVIEVKDGGNNPNARNMPSYRAKSVAKEKMMSQQGTYSYLKLTNNQFEQLIEALYELKSSFMDDSEENRKVVISINEELDYTYGLIKELMAKTAVNEMGGLAGGTAAVIGMRNQAFISQPVMTTNTTIPPTFITRDIDDPIALGRDINGKLMKIKTSSLDSVPMKIYKYKKDSSKGIKKLIESIGKPVSESFIFETLTGKKLSIPDQLQWDQDFEEFDINQQMQEAKDDIYTIIGKLHMIEGNGLPFGTICESTEAKRALERNDVKSNNIVIFESDLGYYAINKKTLRRTNYVTDLDDITIQEDML